MENTSLEDIVKNMNEQGEDPIYLIGSVVIMLLALVIRYVKKNSDKQKQTTSDYEN